MDAQLRAYLREVQAGTGTIEYYLQLLERAGQAGPFIAKNLSAYHAAAMRHYLLNPGSLEHSSAFADRLPPVVDAISWLMQNGLAERALIICPATKISIWSKLLLSKGQIVCDVGAQSLVSPRRNRAPSILAAPVSNTIYLISYDRFGRAASELISGPSATLTLPCVGEWPIIVCDEAHYIRHTTSQRHQAVVKFSKYVHTKWRIAITACPVLSGIEDIYGLYQFIDPEVFPIKLLQFRQQYMIPTYHPRPGGGTFATWALKDDAITEVMKKITFTLVPSAL